ncbi:hypothetical protein L1987_38325 [Smallanthus sonchifolius]|uniref:Uncharacterized protein n=1 Tax=Smallanthus sonchifolius TaxID=185202 RepID=A0ACB9HIB4_9ASTR|nr:hypothetical protein L1987_38325 [Smallanthus sonchifolius]
MLVGCVENAMDSSSFSLSVLRSSSKMSPIPLSFVPPNTLIGYYWSCLRIKSEDSLIKHMQRRTKGLVHVMDFEILFLYMSSFEAGVLGWMVLFVAAAAVTPRPDALMVVRCGVTSTTTAIVESVLSHLPHKKTTFVIEVSSMIEASNQHEY